MLYNANSDLDELRVRVVEAGPLNTAIDTVRDITFISLYSLFTSAPTRVQLVYTNRWYPEVTGRGHNFFLSNIWQPFSIDCRSTRVRPPRRGGHHGRAQASKPDARPALLAAVKAVGHVYFPFRVQ